MFNFLSGERRQRFTRAGRYRPQLEELEARIQPSATSHGAPPAAPLTSVVSTAGNAGVPANALQPAQVRHAYGIDKITFPGGGDGDGSGQTIAIVNAYHHAQIADDLDTFDKQFAASLASSQTLYDAYGASGSFLTVVNQFGGTAYPAADPGGAWALETALDVQWAHVVAPRAKILLVEAPSNSLADLFAAVDYAARQASVVSLSWGAPEFAGQTGIDALFSSYPNVTFVAAAGDRGAGVSYPAASPFVLSVGGTSLSVDATSAWLSETGWSAGGGGVSQFEPQPTYQAGVVTQSTSRRATPDVAYHADPNTGFAVYSSVPYSPADPSGSLAPGFGWFQVGGTSAGAPQWAGLVAVADQGRATPLGSTATLTALYQMDAGSFHDVASGDNGTPAGPGFDLVTGRGTPQADKVVGGLVSADDPAPAADGAPADKMQMIAANTGGQTASPLVSVVVLGQLAPQPAASLAILGRAQASPAPFLSPAGTGASTVPPPAQAPPTQSFTAAPTLPAILSVGQSGDVPAARATDTAADPQGPSSGETPAPAGPDASPKQEGRPSKRSEDVPPPTDPAPEGVPTAPADVFFSDESAVALLVGRDSVVLSSGENMPRPADGLGFAVAGLAAMFGYCWLESEADRAAARRRAWRSGFPVGRRDNI